MASSLVAAAPAADNVRNEAVDHNPPPPPPDRHPVYLDQLFREPPRRHHVSRELPFLCRNLTWGLLIFLAVSCLVVLVWMVFHPTFAQLRVASAAISTIALTATAATAECNVTFLLTNPNRHLSTIYDRVEIGLFYPPQQVLLSHDFQPPFVQPKRSRVTFESNLSFKGADLGSDVVNVMKQELDRGSLSLGIKVLAVVRYGFWKWKSRSQYMRGLCIGVSFAFTSSNSSGLSLNPYQECEVYLYTK